MEYESKNALRQKLLLLLRNQKEDERFNKSRMIQQRLFATEEFQRSRRILFYASFDGEVETFAMMKQAQTLGKKIALPAVLKDQKKIIPSAVNNLEALKKGPYGILQPNEDKQEPFAIKDLDLVIVPGLAFDRQNHRLGRGAGYYDRFLNEIPPATPTVGLAFDFQIVERLPDVASHDRTVSRVIVNPLAASD